MDRFSTIEVFVFLVLLELLILGVLIPVNTRGPHYRYATFDIFVWSDDVVIIPLDEPSSASIDYSRWYDDPELIGMDSVMIRPHHDHGPWPGVFEFYSSERCLSSLDDLSRPFRVELDDSHRQEVFDALVAAAEQHSWLASHQPGAAERVVFRPDLLLVSLGKFAVFFGLPYLLALGIGFCHNRFSRVPDPNRCGCCGYDCRDLPAPNCPECGNEYR